MKQPQRVRLIEKGWESYTGHFAGVEFTNGLSDTPVITQQATHMGAIIRVECVDSGFQVGAGQDQVDITHVPAPIQPERSDDEASEDDKPAEAPVGPSRMTREELHAVADAEGIHGLRQIAERYGVKGRGIGELIEEILVADAKLYAQA